MVFSSKLVCSIVLSLGVLVELLLVFLVFLEVVPIEAAKVLSVTCAEKGVCSHL